MKPIFLLKTVTALTVTESQNWSTEDGLESYQIKSTPSTLEEDSSLEWWQGLIGIAGLMLLFYTLYSFVRGGKLNHHV